MAQLNWVLKHPRATMDHLGYIPSFIDTNNPAPAAKQIDDAYISGWSPFGKGRWTMAPDFSSIRYPGDPAMPIIAEAQLRDETLRLYDGGPWLAIFQKDGSYEIARMD